MKLFKNDLINDKLIKDKLVIYLIFLFSIGLLISLELSLFHYTVDDAYVGIRYAQNLVDGYGFAYNHGERLEGYSTFLWILLFSLFLKLNLNVILAAKITGMIFSVLNLFIVYKLAKLIIRKGFLSTKLTIREDLLSLIPVVLLSITPAYALWAVGALETQMFIFFFLLGIYFFVKEIILEPAIYLSSIFFALAALVRHEAAVLFVISFFFRCFYLIKQHNFLNKPQFKKIFLWGLLFCLIYSTFFIWRIAYFGHVFPSPFFAKNSDFESSLINTSYNDILPDFVQNSDVLMKGLVYLGRLHFELPFFVYLLPFLLSLIIYLFYLNNKNKISHNNTINKTNLSSKLTYELNYLLIIIFSTIIIGLQFYDWMPGHRYLLASFPLMYICFIIFFNSFIETINKNKYKLFVGILILFFILSNIFIYTLIKDETIRYSQEMDNYIRLGFWLNKNILPNSTLAIQNAGIIPYFANLSLVHIHQMPVLNKDIVYNSTLTYDYIFDKKPDLIILFSKTPLLKNNSIYPIFGGFYIGLYEDTRFLSYYSLAARFCNGENSELLLFKINGKTVLTKEGFMNTPCVDSCFAANY